MPRKSYFGFTPMKHNQMRKKTAFRDADTLSYFVSYEPARLPEQFKRTHSMKRFKYSFSNTSDFDLAIKMIHTSFNFFSDVNSFANFDVVLGIESSALATHMIGNEMVHRYKNLTFYPNAFRKNRMCDLRLRKDLLAGECIKTQNEMKKWLKKFLNNTKPAKISCVGSSSRRRYFRNLLSLNIDPNLLRGKRILVIDDTVGEFTTFYNAHEELKANGVEGETYFAIMKDYCINYDILSA